jgi:hypothetical protein
MTQILADSRESCAFDLKELICVNLRNLRIQLFLVALCFVGSLYY